MIERKLSSLVKDVDNSFWNGKGTIKFESDLARALADKPGLTVANLRADHPDYVDTGVAFNASTPSPITLGEPRGADKGFSISFGGELGFWIRFFQSRDGFKRLDDEDSLRLVLARFVKEIDASSGLVVLDFTGAVNAGLTGTGNFGSAESSLTIGAGAAYRWAYCRPTSDGDSVLDSVSDAFSNARLPQTDLERLASAKMLPNEILMTRHLAFFNLNASVSWGYEFTGSKDYAIGAKDLTTKLTVAAAAKLDLKYSIAGEFQTVVLRGSKENSLRIVVDKDRSSTFGIGLGARVGISLDTPAVKEDGIKLLEAVLGITTPQILNDAIALADLTPEELEAKADGFVKALIAEWTGKAFDEVGPELETVLTRLRAVRDEVEGVDDQIIGVYEQYVGKPLSEWIVKIEEFIRQVENFSGRDLIDRFVDPEQQQFMEQVTGLSLPELFVAVDQRRDDVLADVLEPIEKFKKLVTSDAESEIRSFIESKKKALGLRDIVEELKKYETPEKLEELATDRAKEFVGRLFDKTWTGLVEDGGLGKGFRDIQGLVKDFESVLNRMRDVVARALNAKGRLEISYAYERVRETDCLIDVEFDVSSPQGKLLFDSAVEGGWSTVFQNENLPHLKIRDAAFTDTLLTTKTLDVHVFGLTYRSVITMLDSLDSKIEVGPDGLVTVYNLRFEGRRATTTDDRETELTYLLQVAGRLEGAFDPAEMPDQEIDALKALSLNLNAFTYVIEDDLADLDEVSSYLAVGTSLNILRSDRAEDLLDSIRRLRRESRYLAEDLGRISLKYTVSYRGELLAKALFWDQRQAAVPVWSQGGRHERWEADYRAAIGYVFADCLISGHKFSESLRRTDLVPLLYKRGLYGALLSTYPLNEGQMLGILDELEQREWSRPLVEHANVLFRASQEFAGVLEDLRQAVVGEKMKVSRFREQVKSLIQKLDSTARGEGVDGYGVSLLLLDALVQRWIERGPGLESLSDLGSERPARSALVEISLFGKDDSEPIERIQVAG